MKKRNQSSEEAPTQPKGAHSSSQYPVLICVLSFILPIVLSMILYHQISSEYVNSSINATTDNELAKVQRIVQADLQQLRDIAASMAQDTDLAEQLSQSNEQLERRISDLKQSNPMIQRVIVTAFNKVLKREDLTPALNFSQLNMLRTLEKSQQPSIMLSTQEGQKAIRIGQILEDRSGTPRGVMIIIFDAATLFSRWTNFLDPNDYLEIKHKNTDSKSRRLRWVKVGNEPKKNLAKSKAFTIDNAQWSLSFAKSSPLNIQQQQLALPLILGAATGLLSTLLCLFLWNRANRRTQKNLQVFVTQFKDKPNAQTHNLYNDKAFDRAHLALQNRFQHLIDKAAHLNVNQKLNTENRTDLTNINTQETELLDIDLDLEDDIDFESPEVSSMNQTAQSPNQNIPGSIFRQYDIRGIVGETLNESLMTLLGQAIASFALNKGETSIVVGRDGRLSSNALSKALVKGILSTGCDVKDIGEVPTPVVYYGTFELKTRSGIMITGSHNPANYNGLKIVIAGETLYGESITYLKNLIEVGHFEQGKGEYKKINLNQRYIYRISNDVSLTRPLKVVVDAGNGVAGPMIVDLLEVLGCQTIPLYCDIDGNFPNHHPDPSKPENLKELIEKVKESGADIGLAFDGDGDRLGVVTPKGKIIFSDRLLMLYVKDILLRNPGGEVIFDVKCTNDLSKMISSLGGSPIMWKTGHSLIKAKLKETGALIAGEMSGHIFFNDRWYGFDDGLYSAARLLELLATESDDADTLFDALPEKISTPEINIAVTEETKFQIMDELLKSGQFGGNIITIDGVRVDYPNRWGLVRASNTTPNLVARFEGDSPENLALIKREFKQNLRQINPDINLSF